MILAIDVKLSRAQLEKPDEELFFKIIQRDFTPIESYDRRFIFHR